MKSLPGRKDAEGPQQLLASWRDPKNKVTDVLEQKNRKTKKGGKE
jgi:hypothetical protein